MLIKLANVVELNDYRKFLNKLEDLGGELSFLNLIPEKGEDSVKDVVTGISEYVETMRDRLDMIEELKTFPIYIDTNGI